MRRVLSYARSFDQLVLQHPEEPSLAGAGEVSEGEIATRLGLPAVTPMAEVIMIERDLRLVEVTGGRYHAAHVSTAAAIDVIRKAKADGMPVTCDTAPPYFALNETAIGDYRTFAKLSPPLRSEADRRAVIAGLRDGAIDAIASDHAPWDQDSKRLPFSSAACGIVGLETLLPLSLELYHNGHLDLIEVLRLLTINPAGLLRLDAGSLAVGKPADLLVFDPHASEQIRTDEFRSKSKNAPFDGRPVRGRVERTIVDGRTVYLRQGRPQ
jgi:dihydroorotase